MDAKASGFKRILVRLDEGTRRKYCSRALEEDLQRVKSQMRACGAAMAETKQVDDATRKLHSSQRAVVSNELLSSLETLLKEIETSTNTLIGGRKPQNGKLNVAKVENEVKEEVAEDSTHQEAKMLVKKIVVTKELEKAVSEIRQLERLMPVIKNLDEKKKKWWMKHVQKVVEHAVGLVKGGNMVDRRLGRLDKTLKKIGVKCPELKEWNMNMQKQIAVRQGVEPAAVSKSKKKRAIALPDDDETTMSSGASSVKSKKAKSSDTNKEKKGESTDKSRALLQRCSREVRTLRDKFELGAYDVNLSRMVTIVDSLSSGLEHSEVVSLTTTLFTLVETVEKVVHQGKRKDRLVCLESVLGVVLGSSKLQLTARRRTMVEEYANNCRQSLEQLNRQSDSSNQPDASNTIEQASSQNSVLAATRNDAARAKGGAYPKSHVRFG
ncbi:Hypothetical protein PHPALM_16949 [Phytophthora palmivora]|uniref:Uncharacterized protein n=1 Tax=Phytophthora palmivora TaxID=4796 RepID=A0A2P4XNG1_9STRA|nr:Hypothetical protein PHPALM_16949 [Phytophthora palmivora]